MVFSSDERKDRRMYRLAQIIFDHWEESCGMDTRFFEVPLIHDSMVEKWQSVKGGSYREHVVPRVLIRDECLKLFEKGATIEQVKEMLMRYLWIARITDEERERLDFEFGHKTTMPEGWVFGEGDPLARLKIAGIEVELLSR